MKQLLTVLLVLALAMLSGCENTNDNTIPETEETAFSVVTQDNSWYNIQQSGKLVIGVTDTSSPVCYENADSGEFTGFDIDLAQAVCDTLGIALEIKPVVWETKELELRSNSIDCIWGGLVYDTLLQEQIALSEPYLANRQVIMVREASAIFTREDLAAQAIGVKSNSFGSNILDETTRIKSKAKAITVYATITEAVTGLDRNAVDAVILDEAVAAGYMEQNKNLYRLVQTPNQETDYLCNETYTIGFRTNDVQLKEKIQTGLEELANNGTVDRLCQTWFNGSIATIGP